MGAAETPARRLAVARTLATDGVAVEVVGAFREAGVRPILLKGPALARLLYPNEMRSYVDVDLLVSGPDAPVAEGVLEGLGFERQPIAVEPDLGLPHAWGWARPDGNQVDLHRTLAGVAAAPGEAWEILERRTQVERVASLDLEVLDEPARALVVALHASQHGTMATKPIEDLRRALRYLSEETWREAAELAGALDAGIAFSSGLRLLPAGQALAERLGLPDARLVDTARTVGSPTRLALGFERLAATRGAREKLALVLHELAPSPDHMRWWSPLARRGRLGLAAAYAQRAFLFLRHTPPSLLAWRRLSHPHRQPVADGWYRLLEGARSPEDALLETPGLRRLPRRLLGRLMGWSPTRGVLLFLLSVRHPAIGLQREEAGWATLLALRALFGRRRKLVSLQHIVHPRRHPLRRLLNRWDRWATRRALLRGHALSRADLEALPRRYGLPPERFAYVPWPLAKRPPGELPPAPEEPLVLCAGRAYCDWHTLFAAATGAGWPLTVVCARRDLRRVRRLNRDVGATVLTEIPAEDYARLLRRASVSVVAMAEVHTSQGHIRVMDAGSNGVPLVASATRSIAEYVEHERTGLLAAPGDPVALRKAVDRLLVDRDLAERLRREAYARALRWQHYDYLATLSNLLHGRPVELPPGAPGAQAQTFQGGDSWAQRSFSSTASL